MKRIHDALLICMLAALLIGITACQREPERNWREALQPLPEISLQRREAAVAEQLAALRARVEATLSSPSVTEAEASRVLLELARSYMAYEFDPAARALFAKLLQMDPNQRAAHYLIAVLLQRVGELEQAELHLQHALRLASGDGNSLLRLGEIALSRNDLAGADSYFKRAASNSRTELAARAGSGRVALARGDFNAAKDHLEFVLQRQPEASALRHPLAQALRERGQDSLARAQLLAAGDTPLQFNDPLLDALSELVVGARSLLTRGRRAMEAGKLELAEQMYRDALEADPQFALAEHGLGMALVAQSRVDEALPAFQRATDLDPAFIEAWFNLATAALRLQQLPLADAAYVQVLALDPGHHEARLRRSAIFHAQGQPDAARGLLEQILDSDPQHLEALRSLIRLQPSDDHADRSQRRLQQALDNQTESLRRAELEVLHGELALQQGNELEAMAAFERALESNPEQAQVWYNLGVLQTVAGEHAQALEAHRQALTATPDDSRYRLALSRAQIAAEDPLAARHGLQQGLQRHPDNGEIAALLIELLAASPDSQVRDGSLALELAQQMAMRYREPRFVELTAMALAELGEFEQAAELIQRMLAAPQTEQAPEQIRSRLESALDSYRNEQPARMP